MPSHTIDISGGACGGKNYLLTSGSHTNPSRRAVDALAVPPVGLCDPASDHLLEQIKSSLRTSFFQTDNPYTFAFHGTGVTGLSGMLDNLIEPGDGVLVAAPGYWGDVAAAMAIRFRGNVSRKEKAQGEPFSPDEIQKHLSTLKPKVLFMVYGDTGVGLHQRLEEIGQLCEEHDCLLAVDGVGIFGQQAVGMDASKIDAIYANTQKGLGGIVGLAPVSFSPRAMAKIRARSSPPVMWATDVVANGRMWNIEPVVGAKKGLGVAGRYVHTLSHPLLHMLLEAMSSIEEEGTGYYQRTRASSEFVYKEAGRMGLKCLVAHVEHQLQGTASFHLPPGKDAFKIEQFIKENFQICISPGFGPYSGKALRIGLYGDNATVETAKRVMQALEIALKSPLTDTDY